MVDLNATDVGANAAYFAAASALYLLPLIVSSRARTSPGAATGIVIGVMVLVLLIVSTLYSLGAGLFGSWRWQTYVWSVAFYLIPGIVIFPLWVMGTKVFTSKAD